MKYEELCGQRVLSGVRRITEKVIYVRNYGEDVNGLIFCIDGVKYKVLEDPDDGYRSYCRELEVTDDEFKPNIPDTPVVIYRDEDEDKHLIHVQDLTTHKDVLVFGTDHTDGYYPVCIMRWNPENLAWNANEEETK